MIGVVIADDQTIMREGLRALLEREEELKVLDEAENGRRAVECVIQHRPQVVLLDLVMPILSGIEACREIRSAVPETKVIALSMHVDQCFVASALEAGAAGYLVKDCSAKELIEAIHNVVTGQIYLSPLIAKVLVEDYLHQSRRALSSSSTVLTSREKEVLQLIAEGKATKEIASELKVSVKTVETHRKQIMNKLELHSVAELTKFALREGLTSL